MKMEVERVHFMPNALRPGILYVTEEFGTAAHLCACGCGAKIRTPLGPTEWEFTDTKDGPSLKPSVGNWQQACRSHYWISRGNVIWGEPWPEDAVLAGRKREEERRQKYFEELDLKVYSDEQKYEDASKEPKCRHLGHFERFWLWLTDIFRRK